MPKYIVHHEGFFFEWSTVVDAPTSYGMPREEFEDYYRNRYGEEGSRELSQRLERAIAKGTSSRMHASAEELVRGNHAGPGEETISLEDIIRIYVTERPTLDTPSPA